MNPDSPRLRLGIVGIVAVSLFAALFARLWYLQVMASPEYQVAAQANQRRTVLEAAPRGRILDRNGLVVVDNRLSAVVTIEKQELAQLEDDERAVVVQRLVDELNRYGTAITVEQLEKRLNDVRFSPYMPVPIAEDVPEALLIYLSEHYQDFPGVSAETRTVRTYPFGRLASHVVGYVGPINEDELAEQATSPKAYQLGDEIGKSGVEQVFEADLRGMPGKRVLEVDNHGRTVRELSYVPPLPGNDLQLTIDVNVQGLAEQTLREEIERTRGRRNADGSYNSTPGASVVVLRPQDGAVVAMASYPDYDPTQFVNGIDSGEWAQLQDPAAHNPLNNRAIQGQYAPGSTFKLVTAVAALRSGAITAGTTIEDGGAYRVRNCRGEKCEFTNARRASHGRVDLRKSLTVSSDVFYYALGDRFWYDRGTFGDPIQAAAADFGLGVDSGVQLPYERSGFVPDPAKKAARHEEKPQAFPEGKWRSGDNINLSIGQGDLLVTPLQLANVYATFANGGTIYAPNIVSRVLQGGTQASAGGATKSVVVRTIDPRPLRTIDLPPGVRDPILQGLVGVTTQQGGTAAGVFSTFPDIWQGQVAGKTGTAQVAGKTDTAIFAGFAPASAPEYVGVTIMEESGFGSAAAAPVIRRIFEPLADPAVMPTVGPGGVLSLPIPDTVQIDEVAD